MATALDRRLARVEDALRIDDFEAWLESLSDEQLHDELIETLRATLASPGASADQRKVAAAELAEIEAGRPRSDAICAETYLPAGVPVHSITDEMFARAYALAAAAVDRLAGGMGACV